MSNIIPLFQVNQADLRKIIRPITVAGFMSGTSLDGVDVAVIRTNGTDIFEIGPHTTLPYSLDFQKQLQELLGSDCITPQIADVTRTLMDYHVKAYQTLMKENDFGHSIDLVAVHGHTLFHAPKGPFPHTWQICDPEYLQEFIKKPIVFDFRSEDVIHGGEGAPLVPVFHQALSRKIVLSKYRIENSNISNIDLKQPLVFLNIGGVSNITYVDDYQESKLFAGDLGPGNALINDYVSAHFHKPYDEGGRIALFGKPHVGLIQKWLHHVYFSKSLPKSLDRNTFSYVFKDIEAYHLTKEDAVATLSELTVQAVTEFLSNHLSSNPSALIVCGGGAKNHYFLSRFKEELPYPIHTMDECSFENFSLHNDAVEAQAFAYLGARVYFQLPTSFPTTTGVAFPVSGGRFLDI